MLVLSRKVGEKICIGGNITLTVLSIDAHKTRLGIEAPRDIPVYRQELLRPPEEEPPAAEPLAEPTQ